MAFRTLVESGVDLAFSIVGDLAKDVTLTNESVTAYNFGTQVATETSTTITLKGILQEVRRESASGDRAVLLGQMLVKKSDIGEPDGYDTATFDGEGWKVIGFVDNDYAITLDLRKEV